MGVVMSHKDPNSVHPLDLAKPQIPRNDHFFNRFCSPCYHKRKKPHTSSLPLDLSLKKPMGSPPESKSLQIPKGQNINSLGRRLSPIPSIQTPNLNTIDRIDAIENSKEKSFEKNPSRKISENTQVAYFNTDIVRVINNYEKNQENSDKTDSGKEKKTINSHVLDKSLEKSDMHKIERKKSMIKSDQNIDRRSYNKKISIKTQESGKNLEESIRMGPLPEFQVNNLSELLNDRFENGEDQILGESIITELRKIQLNFQKGNKLGKGPNGKVYECLNLDSGEILAVKTINVQLLEAANALFFQKNLIGLKHENVLGYLDFGCGKESENGEEIELVSEYIAGGSLKNLLNKFGKFEETVSSLFTAQILNGLTYLHEKNIVHRNLKSTNCLVESNGTVKLSDYFLLPLKNQDNYFSKSEESLQDSEVVFSQTSQTVLLNPCDARNWMSPETYFEQTFTEKSDIWSLGCIVFEMLVGQSLFSIAMNKNKTIEEFFDSVTDFFPETLSAKSRDFLTLLLKYKTEDRANLEALRTHKFLEISGVEIFDEDNEELHGSMRASKIDKEKSIFSKSNFSVLASLVNSSMQESHQINSNLKSLKKKPLKSSAQKSSKGEKCQLKKIFRNGGDDWDQKVIEEKEMERSVIGEESMDDFQRRRTEFEQNLFKDIHKSGERQSIKTKKKVEQEQIVLKDFGSDNSSMDFNAKKRMEFEKQLLKELEGNNNIDSVDFNAKKRMEFEQKLLKELEKGDNVSLDSNTKNRMESEKKIIKENEGSNNTSLDYFAQKRMEYEQKMIKEFGSSNNTSFEMNNHHKFSHEIKRESEDITMDFNAKKRMEYEQKLLNEMGSNYSTSEFNAKEKMELEQKIMKELEKPNSNSKNSGFEKIEFRKNSGKEKENEENISSLDFNAKKRKEFEQNLLKELEGV